MTVVASEWLEIRKDLAKFVLYVKSCWYPDCPFTVYQGGDGQYYAYTDDYQDASMHVVARFEKDKE